MRLEAELRTLRVHLRRPRRAAGPLHQLRRARAAHRGRARRRRPRRARERHRDGLRACIPASRPTTSCSRSSPAHRNGDVAARIVGALRGDVRVAAALARGSSTACLPGETASDVPAAGAQGAFGVGWVEGWRGEVFVALEAGADGRVAPLPSARPVVAELAGARARGDRQHRSRLPADQQVVQPVLRRRGPLAMHKILLKIAQVGIVHRAAARARRGAARRRRTAERRGAAAPRPRARHPPRRRRLVQRLRARDPRASTTPTTTSRAWASSSSPARATPTCCW